MRIVPLYLAAVAGTIKRDALIFLSYRMRVVSQVLSSLFSLATFYYVNKIVRPHAVGPAGQYFTYVVLGILTTIVLTSALGSAQIIRMELMAGNFERVLVSPFGPVWGVVAVVAFPILYSVVLAVGTLALAALIFGISVNLANALPALGIGILGAISLGCIGLLFAAALLAFKSSMGASWVIAGLSLLGGAYFPLRLFPSWIRWVSDVQPFTPTVDLLRHLLIGTRTIDTVSIEVLKLIGFTAVLMPLSVGMLSLAIRFSRRRGTIMEY